jgi:polysaccharide deacetylase family protein (PEP-CTERM system associated)
VPHALTVDVEDWYQVENLKEVAPADRWNEFESRLERNQERLLKLFDRQGVKATFFVLGRAAERHPGVVKRIVEEGHELACHGWSHELIYRQSRETFRDETRRAKALLEELGGAQVEGYRASTFSVTGKSLWALDILAEEGFSYDSSIAPLRHDRYGIPASPTAPHLRKLGNGAMLPEFPVSFMRVLSKKLPLGGGFFRLFPLRWTLKALRRYEQESTPAMLYLHPWEIDPDQPRVDGLKGLRGFRHYARLKQTYGKLERLISQARFGTMRDALAAALPA